MSTDVSVVVDRRDGDVVVLQTRDGVEITVPGSVLPGGAEEGSWLRFSLEMDPETTAAETEAATALRERLTSEDDGDALVLENRRATTGSTQ